MTWKTTRNSFTSFFFAFTLFVGCAGETDGLGSSDSKTNWMMSCEKDAECGAELSCIDRICTQLCETDAQCEYLASDAVCAGGDGTAASEASPKVCRPGADGAGASGGTGGSGPSGSGASGGAAGSETGGAQQTGGVQETGGGSSTGGSEASGGTSAGGMGGSAECGCVSQTVGWGRVGGLAAWRDTNQLSPCGDFLFVHTPLQTDPPTESCEVTAVSCQDLVSPADVQAAIEHSDVQKAIAAAPVLYGRDSRPVDGQVFQIDVDGSIIEVGDPCDTCTIPDGVSQLVDLLNQFSQEMLAEPQCDHLDP